VGPRDRVVAGEVDTLRPLERGHGLQRVLGDVDEDRSRTAGRRDVERLRDRAWNIGGLRDQIVVLGYRHRDTANIGLLERISSDGGAGHLAGHRHHGDGVHVRVGDRRNEVRRTWTARRHAHAYPAGGKRVTLGSVTSTLFVAHQDVAQDRRVQQRVVRRQNRATGDTEDGVHPGHLQGTHQTLGSGHLFAHRSPLLGPGSPGGSVLAVKTALTGNAVRQ
jgi:hypothetical protein